MHVLKERNTVLCNVKNNSFQFLLNIEFITLLWYSAPTEFPSDSEKIVQKLILKFVNSHFKEVQLGVSFSFGL